MKSKSRMNLHLQNQVSFRHLIPPPLMLTFTHILRVVILSAAKNLNFTQVLRGDSSLRGVYPEAIQTLRFARLRQGFAQGDKCRRASFRMTKPLQLSIARLVGNSQP
jgi:hypothetical protein